MGEIRWKHFRAEMELLDRIDRACEPNGWCYKGNKRLGAEVARQKGRPKPYSTRRITDLRANLKMAGYISEGPFRGPKGIPVYEVTPKGQKQLADFKRDRNKRIAPRRKKHDQRPKRKRRSRAAYMRAYRACKKGPKQQPVRVTPAKRATDSKPHPNQKPRSVVPSILGILREQKPSAFPVRVAPRRPRGNGVSQRANSSPARASTRGGVVKPATTESEQAMFEQYGAKPLPIDDDGALWGTTKNPRGVGSNGMGQSKPASFAHAQTSNGNTSARTAGPLNDPWSRPGIPVHGDFPNAPGSRRGGFEPAMERAKLLDVGVPESVIDSAMEQLAQKQSLKYGMAIENPAGLFRSIALTEWHEHNRAKREQLEIRKRADEAIAKTKATAASMTNRDGITDGQLAASRFAMMRAAALQGEQAFATLDLQLQAPQRTEPDTPKPAVAFTAAAARAEPEEREGELVPPVATQLADAMRINKPPAPVVTATSIGMPAKKPPRPIDRPPPDVTAREWIGRWDGTPLANLALRKGHTVDSLAAATGYDAVRLAKVADYWLRPSGNLLARIVTALAGDDTREMMAVQDTLLATKNLHPERNPGTDRG